MSNNHNINISFNSIEMVETEVEQPIFNTYYDNNGNIMNYKHYLLFEEHPNIVNSKEKANAIWEIIGRLREIGKKGEFSLF